MTVTQMIATSKVKAIIGTGVTGLSVARFLAKQGQAFVLLDTRTQPPNLAQIKKEFPHVLVETGELKTETLLLADEIIASPGVAVATPAIAEARAAGIPVGKLVAKLDEEGEDGVDLINRGEIHLVVNSPRGRGPRADGAHIRAAAQRNNVPLLTTASAALAAALGMLDWSRHRLSVRTLQEYHRGVWRAEQFGWEN